MEAYNQIRILGKGSFGAAWLVSRKKDGQQFVAKEVRLVGMKPQEKEMAKHEIEMLRKLSHPNITKYIDHFEHKGSLFIVMEYANGGDLYTKIKNRRGVRFSEKEILGFFCQLCLALYHMHEKHILHRDLKSQNIFLTQDGIVKLGDFGISTVLRNTYELKKTVCGTPYYFSPELCLNKPYNNKSDIWAMGCILYELTTLTHAFDGVNMKALVQRILRGVYPPVHSSYSKDLSSLISSMLNIDPNRRPHIQTIVTASYIRSAMAGLQGDLNAANRDHKPIVDPAEKEKEKQEAAARIEAEKQLRVKKEQEYKERQAQQEVEMKRRVENLRKQMEQQAKEHEEKLRKMKEQHQAQQAARLAAQKASADAAEERRRNAARVAREMQGPPAPVVPPQVVRRREQDWDRNMQVMAQEEKERHYYQQQAAYEPPPPPQRQQAPPVGADLGEQARRDAFWQMRQEAEANRRRAQEERQPKPSSAPVTPSGYQQAGGVAHGGHHGRQTPDRVPGAPQAGRQTPQTPEQEAEARKQAFWEMRREAEANKRRLMGLDPEPQVNSPAQEPPNFANPPPQHHHHNHHHHHQPPPSQQQPVPERQQYTYEKPPLSPAPMEAPPSMPPPMPMKCATPPAESEDEDDDTDGAAGFHKFLNDDVVADNANNGDDFNANMSREAEYHQVGDNISAVLNQVNDARIEDFGDPELEPGRFVLEGQTLHLPNVGTSDPLGHRIESLRMFLEVEMGDDLFLRVYRTMSNLGMDVDDTAVNQLQAELPKKLQKFVPVVAQLIVCEDAQNAVAHQLH